jgi:Tfp pilus assembly protein PilF
MQQDWSEAQQQLLAAVHADPTSPEAHNTLGGVYFERGELDEARDQFKASLRLKSNFPEAHYRLGLVYQKQGKAAEAAQEFRAAQNASQGVTAH